jgi:hypothetical protein
MQTFMSPAGMCQAPKIDATLAFGLRWCCSKIIVVKDITSLSVPNKKKNQRYGYCFIKKKAS